MAKKKKLAVADPIEPTREQMGAGAFALEEVKHVGEGAALSLVKVFRRRPMIDILATQGIIGDSEAKALRHYRHHADTADRSPLRDSLMSLLRISGSGNPPGIEILNAIRVRDDCERAAGSLRDILRAVVVDDLSLSQWAMSRNGALESCREKNGKRICRMEPKRKALDIAKLEIQMVARRVEAELNA